MPANSPTYQRQWKARNRWRLLEYVARADREKIRARSAINHEIRVGRVERQPCEVCGSSWAEAHHEDYTRPLDVRWLCRPHHLAWHRERAV